jgi:hypothetical protein
MQLSSSINRPPPFQVGALPVFVVDGDAPALKMRERLKRFHAMNGTRMPDDSGRERGGSVRRNYEFESNVREVVVSLFSHSLFLDPLLLLGHFDTEQSGRLMYSFLRLMRRNHEFESNSEFLKTFPLLCLVQISLYTGCSGLSLSRGFGGAKRTPSKVQMSVSSLEPRRLSLPCP